MKELVDLSIKNIEKNHPELLSSGRILMVEGDGRLGYPPSAPYKAIHVGAAAPDFPKNVSFLFLNFLNRFSILMHDLSYFHFVINLMGLSRVFR